MHPIRSDPTTARTTFNVLSSSGPLVLDPGALGSGCVCFSDADVLFSDDTGVLGVVVIVVVVVAAVV